MRKYIAIGVSLMFLMFMVAAYAQASGQYPSSQSGSQAGGSMSGQSQTANPSDQSSSAQSSSAQAKGKTIEGCIVKEESDFFLVPKKGNPIQLQASGAENPSAHEGHRVKVQGQESSIAAGSASSAGTSGGAAGTASSENPSASQSQSGQAGAVASGNAPSSGSSASGTGNDLHKLANKEMTVDRIDMVSETCPVNWNSKVKSPAEKGSKSSPSGSSTSAPPQL